MGISQTSSRRDRRRGHHHNQYSHTPRTSHSGGRVQTRGSWICTCPSHRQTMCTKHRHPSCFSATLPMVFPPLRRQRRSIYYGAHAGVSWSRTNGMGGHGRHFRGLSGRTGAQQRDTAGQRADESHRICGQCLVHPLLPHRRRYDY